METEPQEDVGEKKEVKLRQALSDLLRNVTWRQPQKAGVGCSLSTQTVLDLSQMWSCLARGIHTVASHQCPVLSVLQPRKSLTWVSGGLH